MNQGYLDQESINWIVSNVAGIQYGAVLITIHDSKIVQIERTEKSRREFQSSERKNT